MKKQFIKTNIDFKHALRQDLWCLSYTVFWKVRENIFVPHWKQKTFCSLKEARLFAKKMWKENKFIGLKPYILEEVVPCQVFKDELLRQGKLTIVDETRVAFDYFQVVR
jgi:hypothetical protein